MNERNVRTGCSPLTTSDQMMSLLCEEKEESLPWSSMLCSEESLESPEQGTCRDMYHSPTEFVLPSANDFSPVRIGSQCEESLTRQMSTAEKMEISRLSERVLLDKDVAPIWNTLRRQSKAELHLKILRVLIFLNGASTGEVSPHLKGCYVRRWQGLNFKCICYMAPRALEKRVLLLSGVINAVDTGCREILNYSGSMDIAESPMRSSMISTGSPTSDSFSDSSMYTPYQSPSREDLSPGIPELSLSPAIDHPRNGIRTRILAPYGGDSPGFVLSRTQENAGSDDMNQSDADVAYELYY